MINDIKFPPFRALGYTHRVPIQTQDIGVTISVRIRNLVISLWWAFCFQRTAVHFSRQVTILIDGIKPEP